MPRTFKHLYPRIYDLENLWLAWRRARRGGKRKWLDVRHWTAQPRTGIMGAETNSSAGEQRGA
jgi:hypothetical protein